MEDFQKDHCTRLTLSKCNILARNLFLEVGSKKLYVCSTQDYSEVSKYNRNYPSRLSTNIYIKQSINDSQAQSQQSLSTFTQLNSNSAQSQLKLSTISTIIQFPHDTSALSL